MIRCSIFLLSRYEAALLERVPSRKDYRIKEVFHKVRFKNDDTPHVPLTKKEFIQEECISFVEFQEKYGKNLERKGLTVEKGYSNYTKMKYSTYLNRLESHDKGSICT